MKKQCSQCKKIKSFSKFCNDNRNKDGKQSQCKDCYNLYSKEYRKTHEEQIVKNNKEYRETHKDQHNEWKKEYRKNPFIRLNNSISSSISHSLHNNKNGRHWETLVGYTKHQLKEHLEQLFESGMNWNNYGQWHVDHIIPVSLWKFESYNNTEFKQCWSLANLQPLWAKDNIQKSNKVA